MKYLSVCSGIEAATAAWHPLGWQPAAFSEIEPFPCSVLAHHYPTVPNLGDMTKFKEWNLDPIDLLVGGTPCQSFSVAGLRKGLDDPRGNLMLTYLAIADKYRPRWLVWENVPGVLSSNGGKDFGTFLGGLGELGYGFAYRVLDAQYFGVAQRRRRVFVVGCLGDWRAAAAVLFERDSLLGNPPPSRQARKDLAPTLSARTKGGGGLGTDFGLDGGLITRWPADVAPTLDAHYGDKMGLENQHINAGGGCSLPDIAMCLNAGAMGRQDAETETLIPTIGGGFDVAHSLRGEGFDASEDGTGRGTPLVPVHTTGAGYWQEGFGTLRGRAQDSHENLVIAFDCKASGQAGFGVGDIASTMRSMGHSNSHQNGGGHQAVMLGMHVRRLTPVECERLQGFPDNYTNVPHRGKPAADGPRYKALGNSMAVPVMHWIGRRIQAVDGLTRPALAAA